MSPAPPVASHPTTPAPCSSFHHARSWFPPRSSPPQTAGSLPHSRSSSRTEICRSTTCGLSSPMAPSRTILRTAQPASPPLLLGPRLCRSSPPPLVGARLCRSTPPMRKYSSRPRSPEGVRRNSLRSLPRDGTRRRVVQGEDRRCYSPLSSTAPRLRRGELVSRAATRGSAPQRLAASSLCSETVGAVVVAGDHATSSTLSAHSSASQRKEMRKRWGGSGER
uniref:Uncharacterized protein n=2 Tax=Aegilops tauschii subsp. strangulata TaxID=200361 RepID=A0A452ZYU4_AEGTS